MPFSLIADDLVNVKADALVVAANSDLVIDGGVGYAVARAAGFRRMRRACEAVAPCAVGEAVATSGFDLTDHVVHAVAPAWRGGDQGERELLASAYLSALRAAAALDAKSVALPLLGAGTFGIPSKISLDVARGAIREFLEDHDEIDVTLVAYSREAVRVAGLCDEVEQYVDFILKNEVARRRLNSQMVGFGVSAASVSPASAPDCMDAAPAPCAPQPAFSAAPTQVPRPRQASERERGSFLGKLGLPFGRRGEAVQSAPATQAQPEFLVDESRAEAEFASFDAGLDDLLDRLDEGFSATLLAFIDARGLTDAQVYKRANMSRQLFSKIRSDAHYQPTKRTVLSLAIALELSLPEVRDLLERAGFALSHSSKFDVIMEYFIGRGIYDVFVINETLFQFDQPLLGGRG